MITIVKKIGGIIAVVLVIAIIFVYNFGYFNVTYGRAMSYTSHQAMLNSYDFIDSREFKLYPILQEEYFTLPCDEDKNCYVFFGTNDKKYEVPEEKKHLENLPNTSMANILVKGYSVKIKDLNHWKYLTVKGDKGISLLNPKFK